MLENKQVLVIDDADTIRTYLHNVLTQKGALVTTAASGQAGLELCATQTFELILLDLFLPDMDGIEVLKQLRTTNIVSTIVMVTGHGGIKSAIVAAQLGADGYIEKHDITSSVRDHTEFVYALEQAIEHRSGIVARQQLEQIRADFYSMVTHDLRNPTSLIITVADMLLEISGDSLSVPQHKYIAMIDNAARRLLRLINDYLDFAKIDAGYLRLDQSDGDLREVVESAVDLARLQTQIKKQTLQVDIPAEPVMAWADIERLKQVVDNLISNAIKYTPENGVISVSLTADHHEAVFTVRDTGIGIAPDQFARLFTKYHRVPGETTRFIAGTGLGLLIVKEITEAHGGRVHVESSGIAGEGATFSVRIPRQPTSAEAPTTLQTSVSSPATGEESPDFTHDTEFLALFWEETRRHIATLESTFEELKTAPADRKLLNRARLASHTLKGNAGAMGLTSIHELATQLDSVLNQAAKEVLMLTTEHFVELFELLRLIAQEAANEGVV